MFPGWTYGPHPFYPPTRPPGNNANGNSNISNTQNAQAGQPQTLLSPTPTYVASPAPPWGQPHVAHDVAPASIQYEIPSAHQGRPMGLETWTNMQRAAQVWPQPVASVPASYQYFNQYPTSHGQPPSTQATNHSASTQQTSGSGPRNGGENSGEGLFKTDEELLGQSAFNNPQLPLGRQYWPPSLVPGQLTNVNTLYYCENCKVRSEHRICPDCRTPTTSMHGSYYSEQYNAIWRNR